VFCLSTSFNPLFFTQIEVKKSKFITYIFEYTHISDIKSIINDIKPSHIKARHFVYASRHLNKYNQIVEAFSDDGEPKNSSAPSILNVLRGEDLINIAVIVVRYFGGTKLGVGGLVRAYGSSCASVIQDIKEKDLFITYQEIISYSFVIDYTNLSKIQYQLEKNNLNIKNKDFLINSINIDINGIQKNIDIFIKENNLYIKEIK
jgi:uncharacterized YigZ family protein